jgi:hypothetical protein
MAIRYMPDKSTDKPAAKRMRTVVEEVTEDTSTAPVEEAPLAAAKTPEEIPDALSAEPETLEPAVPEQKITSFSMMDTPKTTDNVLGTKEAEATPIETKTSEVPESLPEPEAPASTESQVSSDEIKEWLNNVRPDTTNDMQKSGGGGIGRILAILVVVLILVALGGGIYYYRANVEGALPFGQKEEMKEEAKTQETTQQQVTEAPTPTVVALDLSEYKVQVLNGAGIAGEAGKAQGYLEGVGFKEFTTGNAPSFGYAKTEVQMKKDISEEVFTKLKEALDPYYVDVTRAEKVLAESSTYDIVVTVGKKK